MNLSASVSSSEFSRSSCSRDRHLCIFINGLGGGCFFTSSSCSYFS